MRLWSIHPSYLDARGLTALWREGLLAQKVLQGKTKGYKNHPQLIRFKNTEKPAEAVACYLSYILEEAERRGYSFDKNKILRWKDAVSIEVAKGQAEYEFMHLSEKLKIRDPERYHKNSQVKRIRLHPIFIMKEGGVELWEKKETE